MTFVIFGDQMAQSPNKKPKEGKKQPMNLNILVRIERANELSRECVAISVSVRVCECVFKCISYYSTIVRGECVAWAPTTCVLYCDDVVVNWTIHFVGTVRLLKIINYTIYINMNRMDGGTRTKNESAVFQRVRCFLLLILHSLLFLRVLIAFRWWFSRN